MINVRIVTMILWIRVLGGSKWRVVSVQTVRYSILGLFLPTLRGIHQTNKKSEGGRDGEYSRL